MDVAAFVVSLLALAASGGAVWYTRTQALAAKRADQRARTPNLVVTPESAQVSKEDKQAVFYVENQGAEDLDSVVLSTPTTSDGVVYPVARLGQEFGDEVELGPLGIKAKQAFVLSIGSAERLPEFHVRLRTRIGKDEWPHAHVLRIRRPRGIVL